MADDKSKFRIAVVGIGGVGGFVGGKLAARFENSEIVEVILAARGKNEKAIRANGLKLIATEGEQIVKPKLIATEEIGNTNLLLLCTKEYDLEETISSLKKFIGEKTVILPLLNGVDTAERIAGILPDAEIWQGCIYVASRLTKPGVVQEMGNICLIYFGDGKARSEKTEFVETVFREAGIDAHFAEDILAKIWEKFVFISALAASTSYFNATIRGVLDNQEYKNLFDNLLAEIKLVAAAKRIGIS
ncbi:MAG TPA: 2-dehydropantoate 2-reductase, partial [Pyrinomonadaceae bacterium]|nr:2-dehydropantoate 2-reductase [Pyrinomonadaceae bacterium]